MITTTRDSFSAYEPLSINLNLSFWSVFHTPLPFLLLLLPEKTPFLCLYCKQRRLSTSLFIFSTVDEWFLASVLRARINCELTGCCISAWWFCNTQLHLCRAWHLLVETMHLKWIIVDYRGLVFFFPAKGSKSANAILQVLNQIM